MIEKTKSRGQEMISEHLKKLNKSGNTIERVQFVDLEDDNGNPIGTKVIIKIPVL
ncbi:hypothetical protein IWQ47_004557 [Aquimarina sp. EL_43]|uniref:hypothetical protein n=1 Tax=unclassified Aquimarina TaxID=2627091 RepID=UPI0018CB7FB8|nr:MULTISPECIES: hypothetical protein [unclassified Aquimarina]MBG6133109.1 hypothetical protein [Aquimarina sp. EL_35]MBG6153267.1 hypothetical protein [Aquimarina sp. EL_32]MBG6171464.1 hypothetical protein [Aquimarina sp. EL_43]